MKKMNVTARKNMKLQTKQDVLKWFEDLFSAAWLHRDTKSAGIALGNIIPLYGAKTAAMETFCRLLWGIFPVIAGNNQHTINLADVFRLIAEGTDPENKNYWGDLTDFDQRCVEMTVLGGGLALANSEFSKYLSEDETEKMVVWLNQLRDVELPRNNWSFFPVIVEMGLCLSGRPYSQQVIDKHFARLDSYYLGEGWYSDGHNRPRDYYNAMALHYYGLFYSKLMADRDPERCRILRERASAFATDFLHMFAEDGAAIPFGRSLTYRFVQVAFWSAAAFAGIDTVPMDVIKGVLLRNLRWWAQQEMTDHCGTLTVGYSYANPVLAEDYNAPGSPYWCCKTFLILILEETHPFWKAHEEVLPASRQTVPLVHPGQLVHHDRINHHHYMLNAGQLPAKNYNNAESKYCKFAYSSLLGFNLERSRYGIELNACDSMLLLSEHDGYYRGRRDSTESITSEEHIFTRWHPWPDVDIRTWLIPLESGHLRIHIISTERPLESVEGGFPVPLPEFSQPVFDDQKCLLINHQNKLYSNIMDLSQACNRESTMVISPPGSNVIFPCCSGVPVLKYNIEPGSHVLASLVNAGKGDFKQCRVPPEIQINEDKVIVTINRTVYEFNRC